MKAVTYLAMILCPLLLIASIESREQVLHATAQLDSKDAALRALAYDMRKCGWRQDRISATLKFYLPGGDVGIDQFWMRVETDTHRNWLGCPP